MGITSLSAGFVHSLAMRQDGTLLAWGSNASGQIGDGTPAANPTPGPVSLP